MGFSWVVSLLAGYRCGMCDLLVSGFCCRQGGLVPCRAWCWSSVNTLGTRSILTNIALCWAMIMALPCTWRFLRRPRAGDVGTWAPFQVVQPGEGVTCSLVFCLPSDTSPGGRGIYPMLFQCWASVFDAGQTLKQHWMNPPCLLDGVIVRLHSADH